MLNDFELEHWQLSEHDGVDAFPLDYRVTSQLKDKCSTMYDVQEHLKANYASNVAVEFNHVRDEAERVWLYENYESMMAEEVTDKEKVKALQLLLRTE
jgi:2-oxoglutarate dehydrogenase complex dehydrogenase (E1) component-like enzyme